MADGPAQELPAPDRAALREFSDIVSPFLHVLNADEHSKALGALSQPHSQLYAYTMSSFTDDAFQRLTAHGDFGQLLDHATMTARTVSSHCELTVPRAFAVQAIANASATIFKANRERHTHVEDRTSYYLSQFATRLTVELPPQAMLDSPDPYLFVGAVSVRSRRIADQIDESPAWFEGKLSMLASRLQLRRHLEAEIAKERPVVVENFDALRSNNTALFEELRRMKRYTIKPAIHMGLHTNWSIHDMTEIQREQAEMSEAAGTDIWPHKWKPAMVMAAVEHDSDALIQAGVNADVSVRVNFDGIRRYVFMNEHGELFGDLHGAMPLYTLYDQAGRIANYEALRQYLIKEYYDLTVPVGIVTEVEAATRRQFEEQRPQDGEDHSDEVVYHNMLLPRLRKLRSITRAQLEAMEQAEQRLAGTRQREHHRPGFAKALPPGHRASEEARQLAAANGVILAEGETYQKAHMRGDPRLGTVVHRAKKRRNPLGDSDADT